VTEPIEEDMAWQRMDLEGNTLIGPIPLCCTLSPMEYIPGKLAWCIFCRENICRGCADTYRVDDYYHHQKCTDLCQHTADTHDEED